MIEVDRSSVARPAVLDPDDLESLGAKETAKAIAYFGNPPNPGSTKPKYKVYSHDQVKEALINLFHLKCAYCEAKVTSARDIEHFRPKGEIDPGPDMDVIDPGYYWLAADWDNLLLSCPDCNQNKRPLVRNDDGAWSFAEDAVGKLTQFPLRDEANRVDDHTGDIEEEEEVRLLLNPCKDEVANHLRFDDEGHVFPRQLRGAISDMAVASIGVYVLWRQTLVEGRKTTYLQMSSCWDDIEFASQMIAAASPGQKDLIWAAIRKGEDELEAFTRPEREFAGMARWQMARRFRRKIEDVKARFRAKFGG